MNTDKKNNKKTLFLVLGIIGAVVLFFIIVVIFIFSFFLIIKSDSSEEEDPIFHEYGTIEDDITDSSYYETPSTIKNLYTMSCSNTENNNLQKYKGYAQGDIVYCTIRFNSELKDFQDADSGIHEASFTIKESNNLYFKRAHITGPFYNHLGGDVVTVIDGNTISLKSKRDFIYDNSNAGGAYIKNYDFNYKHNSIKGFEIHLEFVVQSYISTDKDIRIDISDASTVVCHANKRTFKEYKTSLEYSYNIKDNDKYYVDEDKIYKFSGNSYMYVRKVPCDSNSSCLVIEDKTISLGYVVIEDFKIEEKETIIRVYDIEKDKDYKTYKTLFVVKGEENTYLVGNANDDLKTYTVTRLNDNKLIDTIDVSKADDVYAVTYLHGKLVVYITNKGIKEYEVK